MDLSRCLREKCLARLSIDEKTHRRTGAKENTALPTLDTWSVENRLVLGQLAVEEKSNEITDVPQRMDMLDLKGCKENFTQKTFWDAIVGIIPSIVRNENKADLL